MSPEGHPSVKTPPSRSSSCCLLLVGQGFESGRWVHRCRILTRVWPPLPQRSQTVFTHASSVYFGTRRSAPQNTAAAGSSCAAPCPRWAGLLARTGASRSPPCLCRARAWGGRRLLRLACGTEQLLGSGCAGESWGLQQRFSPHQPSAAAAALRRPPRVRKWLWEGVTGAVL